MARTKNIIDQVKLSHLKRMTEQKFGRPIVSSRDCNDLVNALDEFDANLNAQTIRRLYGLVRSEHSPSLFTLDTLSHYVASCSWSSYRIISDDSRPLKLLADWIFDFYNIPQFGYTKVVDAIAESEDLQNLLLMRLAEIPAAHEMFFEVRPLRDCLNKAYKEVLNKYIKAKKETNEACLFGYGLLFMGAFLTENIHDTARYFKIITQTKLEPEIHNIPAARKFGVPLMYYHLKNDEQNFELTLKGALIKRQDYIVQPLFDWEGANFDFILVEHLLLIRRYDVCKIILTMHTDDKRKYSTPTKVHDHYRQVKLLINALCSNEKISFKDYGKFNVNQIRIGERKYFNMFYLVYLIKHTKTSSKIKLVKLKKQLEALVADTGYGWFYKLVE